MIKYQRATEAQAILLSQMGIRTYAESHSVYIDNKNDLELYLQEAFDVDYLKSSLQNPNHHFYLIFSDQIPIGYARLLFDTEQEALSQTKHCLLDKIYILQDFIHLRVGSPFLRFLEEKASEFGAKTMWLSVYHKNQRAISFYERNAYQAFGTKDFLVNGTPYHNLLYKKLLNS